MKRSDWVLLACHFAPQGHITPIQLQKALFVLGQEAGRPRGFYRFEPYDYGPFSAAIYDDANELADQGLIAIVPTRSARRRRYRVTSAGRAAALELTARKVSRIPYLQRVVEWVQGLAFADLLRAVYAKYPDYATKSVFRNPAETTHR